MRQERSLKKNFVFITVGNLFYTLSQYLLLILFTKHFIKEDVGAYLYAMAFVTPLLQPLEMQFRGLYVTEKGDHLNLSDYHSLRIICNLLSLLLIIFGSILFEPEMFNIILVIGIIKIIESQMDISYASFQRRDYLYYISYSKIIRGLLTVFLVFLLISNSVSLIFILYYWLFLWLLIYIFIDIKWTKIIDNDFFNLKQYFIFSNLKKLLKISWPLFFLDFVDKYYINYPNLFIEAKFGLKVVAIFGSILYFRAIGGQIIAPISNVTAPRLAEYWRENNFSMFSSLLFKITGIALFVGICGIVCSLFIGEWALTFLFTKEYANYNDILVYIMIISTISYSYLFFGTALTCMRKHWIKLPIHILGFVLLIGISYFWEFNMKGFMKLLMQIEFIIALLYLLVVIYFINKAKKILIN